MKWKEVDKNYIFNDNSVVTQKHPIHLYDCYEIEYDNKKIVLSKDHILKINISNLPLDAQYEIKQLCNGTIPLTEDIEVQADRILTEQEINIIKDYLMTGNCGLEIKDISENNIECYLVKFNDKISTAIFIKRIPTKFENQKIDDNNYWIPVEGLAYLFNKYGELNIG